VNCESNSHGLLAKCLRMSSVPVSPMNTGISGKETASAPETERAPDFREEAGAGELLRIWISACESCCLSALIVC
jgi:hypothetical protein